MCLLKILCGRVPLVPTNAIHETRAASALPVMLTEGYSRADAPYTARRKIQHILGSFNPSTPPKKVSILLDVISDLTIVRAFLKRPLFLR